MSRHAIAEKLSIQLLNPIDSEVRVVYVLVELGKLLEHHKKKETFELVNFYRNWAVHINLKTSRIAEKVIRLIDDSADNTNVTDNAKVSEELKGLLNYTSFRQDLYACLEYLELPSTVFASDPEWLHFLHHLSRVIQDCPLLIQANNKKPGTRFVESISLSKKPGDDTKFEWTTTFHTNPKGRLPESYRTDIH